MKRCLYLLAGFAMLYASEAAAQSTNQLFMTGTGSGNAPMLSTNGVDTNINLAIMPKGTGAVGINTTSPASKLGLVTSTLFDGFTLGNGTNTIAIVNGNSAGNDNGTLTLYTVGTANVQIRSTGSSYFNGGSVGIATTAPQVNLDLAGSVAAGSIGTEDEFHITRLINSGIAYPQLASFQLGTYTANSPSNNYGPSTRLDINLKAAANTTLTGDTNVMTLLSSVNVGIGTASPQATLDVNGYARLAFNSSAPVTCSSGNEGSIALTHLAQVCVCDTTPAWHILNTGTACSW
jgi:hypothetical protein